MKAPLARVVVAATLAAATGVLTPAAPASAAPCTSGSGVTVVVDPGALGGALTAACDSGSGQSASARYADVGVVLSYVQRQPGFVCRVDGAPASDPCVNTPPADAYWGLWWSDGESGTWTYSSLGVGGLQVPDGGAVALAWQQGTTRRTPAVAAPVHAAPAPSPTTSATPKPAPEPTRTPTPKPGPTPSTSPTPAATASPTTAAPSATSSSAAPSTSPAASPSAGATASGRPSRAPRTPRPGRSASSSPTPTDRSAAPTTGSGSDPGDPEDIAPAAADPADEQGRLPTWVTLAVLGALVAALATMALAARRRRGDRP